MYSFLLVNYISCYSCYPNLSCLDSSLLVPHPCRHNMVAGVGSVSDLVSRLWVLLPKSVGKVRTVLMISVINTKAKVKLKKGIPFIKKFLCHPYTLISFLDSPQVLHTLSHNSSFITLFPGILIIFWQSPNSNQYMDPYPQILKNRS